MKRWLIRIDFFSNIAVFILVKSIKTACKQLLGNSKYFLKVPKRSSFRNKIQLVFLERIFTILVNRQNENNLDESQIENVRKTMGDSHWSIYVHHAESFAPHFVKHLLAEFTEIVTLTIFHRSKSLAPHLFKHLFRLI